jgi:hypothetical protein
MTIDSRALPRLLTDPEVENILHKGWAAKDRLRLQPRIPHLTIGRSIRYRESDVIAFINRSVKGPQGAPTEPTAA